MKPPITGDEMNLTSLPSPTKRAISIQAAVNSVITGIILTASCD